MNPGQISVQKLNEAHGMVTITKQRRLVFIAETKGTTNADLQVLKFT